MELDSQSQRRGFNPITSYFKNLHELKTSDAFILKGALIASVVFLLSTLALFSVQHSVKVPAYGGSYAEGIVGTTRFINPVLAVTRADKDVTALIYDGLMMLGTDGVLVPNVAESVTISDDGLTYNVLLKHDVTFSDGTPLTARDVAFTVSRIQEPLLNSPLRSNFEGVTVEEVGEHELNFILPEAYTPFIENLTFGILPEHIWKEAGAEDFPFSQYNIEPIGSGPYLVKEIVRNTSGIPETYILEANEHYHIATPRITTLSLHFFPTEEKLVDAFKKGIIEGVAGISAERINALALNDTKFHIERIPLPRTFALFINQNKSPVLRDSAVRKALNASIDRKKLIAQVLGGYGNPLYSPLPYGFQPKEYSETYDDNSSTLENARDILRDGGWKLNVETNIWEKVIDGNLTPLQFSITTANTGIFGSTADFLQSTWKDLGADITIKQFEQSDLTQSIIRPRDYEALLFGTQLGRSLDLYSFWHSSQRNDPGLNISLYANITTDSILTEMRRKAHPEESAETYKKFTTELNKETPAIFLYTPELLYVFPNRITGASFAGVSEPYERFSNIQNWYIQTESIWPIFNENTEQQ